jgi:hypothetical protein
MDDFIFEKFSIIINDKSDNTCSCSIEPPSGEAHKNERRKIYIITTLTKEIFYIGEAHTKIKTRIQRGYGYFNHFVRFNKTRGGYKGYKWLDKIENPERILIVYVASFNNEYDDNRKKIEAIEGELVHLVRYKLNYWPKFQNEIHFSNIKGAKEIADKIYSKIYEQ